MDFVFRITCLQGNFERKSSFCSLNFFWTTSVVHHLKAMEHYHQPEWGACVVWFWHVPLLGLCIALPIDKHHIDMMLTMGGI